MIRDISERYPELKKAEWEETRAFVLELQAQSDAQVQIATTMLDEMLNDGGSR
jgi:hypothetical protein